MLVEHPTPAMVSITGSVRAGMQVAESASHDVKRVHLELGARRRSWCSTTPTSRPPRGHRHRRLLQCRPGLHRRHRVLAAPGIYDDFVRPWSSRPGPRRWVAPMSPTPTTAPQQRRQLERLGGFFDRLPSHAEVVTVVPPSGSAATASPPRSSPACTRTTRSSRRSCSAGITVQRFSDEDEAIAWANGVRYGLASSVWTQNHGRPCAMAKALDFGCVWINTHIPIVAEMPHGGFSTRATARTLVLRLRGLHTDQALMSFIGS